MQQQMLAMQGQYEWDQPLLEQYDRVSPGTYYMYLLTIAVDAPTFSHSPGNSDIDLGLRSSGTQVGIVQ